MALKRPFEDVGSTISRCSAGHAKRIASLGSFPLPNLLNDDIGGNSTGNTKNDVSESISKATSSSAVAASLVGFPLIGCKKDCKAWQPNPIPPPHRNLYIAKEIY